MMFRLWLIGCVLLSAATVSFAHDTWVETNTHLVRTGDVVHIDLKLGNHGNDHRDFKLASKIDLAKCTFAVIDPDGKPYDLKPQAIDTGYAPKEGYWTARFVPAKPGLYTVTHTANAGHLTTRGIKGGKAYFVVSDTLDKIKPSTSGFANAQGHPLELIAETNPVTPMGPGVPIKVRVMYRGKPLADAKVSFVPQGATLPRVSIRNTNARPTPRDGRASRRPRETATLWSRISTKPVSKARVTIARITRRR